MGGGSIGTRHIRNLLRMRPTVEIGVYDPGLSSSPVQDENVHLVMGPDVQGKWDAVLICSPTSYHYGHMSWAISKSIPCFVEKPICLPGQVDLSRNDFLAAWSDSIPVMVGYNLYFHPWFQEVKRIVTGGKLGRVVAYAGEFSHYLPYWRGDRDSYSRHRAQGGGVLLDCIQDLDLMLELGGPWNADTGATIRSSRVGDITEDSEDIALVELRSPSLKSGMLRLDYLGHRRIRSIKVIGTLGTLLWRSERHAPSGEDSETLSYYRNSLVTTRSGESVPLIASSYVDELRAFLHWVEGGAAPVLPNPFRALDLLKERAGLW